MKWAHEFSEYLPQGMALVYNKNNPQFQSSI